MYPVEKREDKSAVISVRTLDGIARKQSLNY